jgi:outer membrane cobalamin receptor
MKTQLFIFLLFFSAGLQSQTTVSGRVLDSKENPVSGANVFLDGTYDGTTSGDDGDFSFNTSASGEQTLVVSFISFVTLKIRQNVTQLFNVEIILQEDLNSLDTVILNAGTFESGDKARVTVLKPLDIVTTAGSAGNIVAALQTLPGTQAVGENGRLFVRGGEADETQTYVDGIRVAQPYGASFQNIPARGRFSPFLFSGISFSTGGYSAEFGEALSGILLLNTKDEAEQNETEISLMTVGLELGNTHKWKKNSLTFKASYINLEPYHLLVQQKINWNKAFQSLSGETVYRHSLKNGRWKIYAAFDASQFDFNQETINSKSPVRINLNNDNFYFNTSYNGFFGNNWQIIAGLGYGYSNNKIDLNLDKVNNTEHATHIKTKFSKRFSDQLKLSFGTELFSTRFDEDFIYGTDYFQIGFQENLTAMYAETDILFSRGFALKLGLRGSYNDYLNESIVSPRISLAYKTGKNSQFSLAYGNFTQAPKTGYLKFSDEFSSEKASHYILNYQYSKNRQILRMEAYYKNYRSLVTFDEEQPGPDSHFNNSGNGAAKGLDIFWRDATTFKNLEYWISYSYIDTKRKYQNFPSRVTPGYVANHNASIVTKYWIGDWRSQIGFSHSFNSGRPFNNPNQPEFMNGKTKAYHNLSFNWAYLLSPQKILYFSVSNILGTQNIFSYEYASKPNSSGQFDRRAITPTADRFFFVGFFWTISDNKKSNQLKNL